MRIYLRTEPYKYERTRRGVTQSLCLKSEPYYITFRQFVFNQEQYESEVALQRARDEANPYTYRYFRLSSWYRSRWEESYQQYLRQNSHMSKMKETFRKDNYIKLWRKKI